jgi:hypothetical protein
MTDVSFFTSSHPLCSTANVRRELSRPEVYSDLEDLAEMLTAHVRRSGFRRSPIGGGTSGKD